MVDKKLVTLRNRKTVVAKNAACHSLDPMNLQLPPSLEAPHSESKKVSPLVAAPHAVSPFLALLALSGKLLLESLMDLAIWLELLPNLACLFTLVLMNSPSTRDMILMKETCSEKWELAKWTATLVAQCHSADFVVMNSTLSSLTSSDIIKENSKKSTMAAIMNAVLELTSTSWVSPMTPQKLPSYLLVFKCLICSTLKTHGVVLHELWITIFRRDLTFPLSFISTIK